MGNGYAFQIIELNQPLRDEFFSFDNYNQEEIKAFVNKYNQENHTKECNVSLPQNFKWILADSWNTEGMKKLDLGVMSFTYKNEEGDLFVIFNKKRIPRCLRRKSNFRV